MISPFDKPNTTVALYLEPYLNTYFKTYHNIITLSTMPTGPISGMVQSIHTNKLSPFQTNSPFSANECTFALFRYPNSQTQPNIKHGDAFMNENDIPSILSYLQSNQYTVDTQLSTMLFKSPAIIGNKPHSTHGKRKLICMFRYTV